MSTARNKRDTKLVKADQAMKEKRKHSRRPVFKLTPFNSGGKELVRLNAKTEAWVTPGTDIEALKKNLRIS